MDVTDQQSKPWSSAQAYGLAVICLLLGLASGYLLHPPTQAVANVPHAASAPSPTNGSMPTPEQMKEMGAKTAEPLLAALRKDPNNAELLTQIASVYVRTQQFPAAEDYYERAVKVKPTAEGYVNLATAYYYAGAGDQAIDTLNLALKLDPKSADALFNLGMLKWRVKNNPKGAIDAWELLLKTYPNHPRRAQVESMIAKAKQHINVPAGAK